MEPSTGEPVLSLETCDKGSSFSGLSEFYLFMSKLCYYFKNYFLSSQDSICSHLFCAFRSHIEGSNSFLDGLFCAYLLSSWLLHFCQDRCAYPAKLSPWKTEESVPKAKAFKNKEEGDVYHHTKAHGLAESQRSVVHTAHVKARKQPRSGIIITRYKPGTQKAFNKDD